MTVAEQFGRNLFMARRRAGLSQEKLAARAGLHRTEIGLLEHGRRIARLDTFVRLIDSLGVDADGLLRGISWLPGDMARNRETGRYAVGDG